MIKRDNAYNSKMYIKKRFFDKETEHMPQTPIL